jgi:Amt family ammonium transporter
MIATISAGDTAWVLVSAALVLLMLPGLALFYGGLVRARATLNTFMMSFVAVAVVTVQWVLFGYSLAFSKGGFVGGFEWAGLNVLSSGTGPYSATIPHFAFIAFQSLFAGLAVALISGAAVERIRFSAYIAFTFLWSTLVYDPLAHWVWATDGWLHKLGALDFAGGTVVHIAAGTAALVAAMVLGRRRDVGRTPLLPHNVPFTLVGAGLLWVGWFGFNGGSALAADGIAATAVITTHTAAASALVVWLLLDMWRSRQATAVGGATGAVVGLVAITPAAGYVSPLSAIAIGALAACASFAAIQLRSRTKVDDALDVFACHGIAGMVGALLTGVFASKAVNPAGADGLIFGNLRPLLVQGLAVACTLAYVAPVTLVIMKAIAMVSAVRVHVTDELSGVDLSEHGEHAYHGSETLDGGGHGVRISDGVLLEPLTKPQGVSAAA